MPDYRHGLSLPDESYPKNTTKVTDGSQHLKK